MQEHFVQIEYQDHVAILTLCRPEKRNALNLALLEELALHLEKISISDTIRGLILQGEGIAFCTGLDLTEALEESAIHQSAHLLRHIYDLLFTMPVITLAAVHGLTLAGGAGLMLACDAAIGAHDVQISFPETQRGIVAAQVHTLMRHRIRPSDISRLLLFNDTLDAVHAYQAGLLIQVVPLPDLNTAALQTINQALKGGPEAVRLTKKMILGPYTHSFREELNIATELQQHVRLSTEAKEGMLAFLEKRSPHWLTTNTGIVGR